MNEKKYDFELTNLNDVLAFKEQLLLRKKFRIWHETWKVPSPRHEECIILANGPSVRLIQHEIVNYTEKADVFTVNLALTTEFAISLKPVVHVLADPVYYQDDKTLRPRQIQSKQSTWASLRTVDWEMQLAVPYVACLDLRQTLSTPHVHISGYPTEIADASLPLQVQYKLAEAGQTGFGTQSVVVSALYIALVAGYKRIWLAGTDADWFSGISVDQHCNMYMKNTHFYHKSHNIWIPGSVKDELKAQYIYHAQMDALRLYADWRKTHIINLSLLSYLDMFPKGRLGEEPFPWKISPLPDSPNLEK